MITFKFVTKKKLKCITRFFSKAIIIAIKKYQNQTLYKRFKLKFLQNTSKNEKIKILLLLKMYKIFNCNS